MYSTFLEPISAVRLETIEGQIQYHQTLHDQNLLNTPDEIGKTLTHYMMEKFSHYENKSLAIRIFVEYNADFSIQDLEGNTPLHYFLLMDKKEDISEYFAIVLDQAAKNKLNFSLLNRGGHALLHLAAMQDHDYLQHVVAAAKRYKLPFTINQINGAGYSALALAINRGNIRHIEYLFEKSGANPLLAGEGAESAAAIVSNLIALMRREAGLEKNTNYLLSLQNKMFEWTWKHSYETRYSPLPKFKFSFFESPVEATEVPAYQGKEMYI